MQPKTRRFELLLAAALALGSAAPISDAGDWRTDPRWDDGKAEWALYEATRVIYGVPRAYQATIFTNKQSMSPRTTTKAAGAGDGTGVIRVFKHNLSEIVPTENYDYRFLTTSFVREHDLSVYKVVVSTQEDCGATYRQIVDHDGTVTAREFCYFPDGGEVTSTFRTPSRFAVHDALTITLRDYPFGAQFVTAPTLALVPDLTNPRQVAMTASTVTISEIGDETLAVPYGRVRTHHLRVDDGDGTPVADYWFAAEPGMRNVLVQYEDASGTRYQLERLAWWAYWSEPRPSEAESTRAPAGAAGP